MEQTLVIESTATTPKIVFEPAKGKLEIKGRSISDDSVKFYQPLLDSIDRYVAKPVVPVKIDIELEYIDTESAKCLLKLLKKMEALPAKGFKVVVNWYYKSGNQGMFEMGKDYQAVIRLDVNLVAK